MTLWRSRVSPFVPRPPISLVVVLGAALSIGSWSAPGQAADTLAYSFEGGVDGFALNGVSGAFASITQDSAGATVGTKSLNISALAGPTIFGALTSSINPTPAGATIGNPPGIDHVLLDLTLPTAITDGNFANISVYVFGVTQDTMPAQAEFDDFEPLEGKTAGTYKDIQIDLTSSTVLGATPTGGTAFNDLFGTAGSGSLIIPTSFQFLIRKSSSQILNISIDNVRLGSATAAIPGDYNGNDKVDAADYTIWRDTFGSMTDLRANGDNNPPSDNKIDIADFAFWKSHFNNPGSGGGGLGAQGVPEPGTAVLMIVAAACWSLRSMRFFRFPKFLNLGV